MHLKVVAKGIASLDDLLVEPTDNVLLLHLTRDTLVELAESGLAVVVDDEDALDHRLRLSLGL